MELLQWHNVYKIGEDEVLRSPGVALICLVQYGTEDNNWSCLPPFQLVTDQVYMFVILVLDASILNVCGLLLIHGLMEVVRFISISFLWRSTSKGHTCDIFGIVAMYALEMIYLCPELCRVGDPEYTNFIFFPLRALSRKV